jgi:hypothetical protein
MAEPGLFAYAARNADPAAWWIGVAVTAGLGVWLLRRGLDALWRLRLIVDTPTARIRSAPQGYVELTGLAAPVRGAVAARLTGTPCAWYRWRIEHYQRSGRSRRWVTLDEGDAQRPFLVDDGTGVAEVLAGDAHLHLRTREQWYGRRTDGHGAAERQPITAFFERHLKVRCRYRMTEERIAVGEGVYILGRFETPRRGMRERQTLSRTLLAQWKRDPVRMRHFDRDGNGEIDLDEWEHARRRAARLAERAEAERGAEPPRPRVVASDDAAHPFVVSTEDEPTLLARLRLMAFGGMAGGALLGVGAAAAALAWLGG